MKRWFMTGLLLVLLVNLRAFSVRSSVPWDARDEMWFYFRWLGSALRAGHFGDFIPNVVAGYPLGANIQSGTYNPLYLSFAAMFPDNVLSINLLYLFLQTLVFSLCFLIGHTYRWPPVVSVFLGLSTVASGFFTGHASHFSYLSSGVGLLAAYAGLRLARRHHGGWAFALAALGTFHAATTGYPSILAFGAQVLAVVMLVQIVTRPAARRATMQFAAGVAIGALLAWPTVWHFFNQLRQSARADGVSVSTVLGGSLPAQSLWNFVMPVLRMGKDLPESVDPTMDRFHLLFLSLPLMVVALWPHRTRSATARRTWLWLGCGTLFLLLALGRHSFIPMREFLAEHFFIYRSGRFPSGEHRGFALFAFALVTAAGLNRLLQRWAPTTRGGKFLLTLLAIDFLAVMAGTTHVRYMRLPENLHGQVPRFRIEYGPGEQSLLDAPRGCPFDPRAEFDQRQTPADRFSWSGYTNLINVHYTNERDELRWALCGPSRLWRVAQRSSMPYRLHRYSPGQIEFEVRSQDLPADGRLLWADVDDGFWNLRVNERSVAFLPGPAGLRYFVIPPASASSAPIVVRMTYLGPLSRMWRVP